MASREKNPDTWSQKSTFQFSMGVAGLKNLKRLSGIPESIIPLHVL